MFQIILDKLNSRIYKNITEIIVYGFSSVAEEKNIMQYDTKASGKRIKQLRQEMNLSQEQLAEKLNVSQNMVAKIECGLRRPSVDFLIELTEFFETSIHYIVLGTSKEATDKKRQIEEAIEQIDQMMDLLQNKRKELLQMKEKLD